MAFPRPGVEYQPMISSHACTVVLGKLLLAMYVSLGMPGMCTPNSSYTDEPRTIKICRENFGLNLIPSVMFGLDRIMGAGAVESGFMAILAFFLFFPLFL
jgi:hypothetical protein